MTALVIACLLMAAPVFGQPADSTSVYHHEDAPTIQAAPLSGTIHVDGRLDEPAWAGAKPAERFTQRDPEEGQPATERTEVRILIGSDALYVGARLYDREPSRIRSRLVRRDEALDSDYFAVYIDSYHDHLTGFVFRVDPAGAINDAAVGTSGNEDLSWDGVWHVHTVVDSLGWTAELEIPLSQLRYNVRGDGVWGIQLQRFVHRKQELSYFAFTPKRVGGGVSRFGHLTGLGHLPAPRRVEVLPYSLARTQYSRVARGDPFRDGSDQEGKLGADLKYGVTSNLTLAATVNPDFGQVEVDPAVVNLGTVETFFPEKRPFFVEGADVFRFGLSRSYNSFNTTIPFHARRIGREPQRTLDNDASLSYFDAPSQTTIATAAKLTGKTAGGWSMGFVDAVTPEEHARFQDTLGSRGEAAVEPLTNYFAGRLRREYRGGDTMIGGIATGVNRDLADPTLKGMLRSQAYATGIDFNHYWAGRRWCVDGYLLGSEVRGSKDAIALAQQSYVHNYQRPDADHLTYDSTRTSLLGGSGMLSLNKVAGKHGLGSLTYQDWSPGFEVNDLGYNNAADTRGLSWLAMYKEDKPARFLRNWDGFVFSNYSWNYGGDLTFVGYAGHVEGQLKNYWNASLRYTYYPGSFDDRLTRGGPLARVPAGGNTTASLSTDPRKPYTVGAGFTYAWDVAGGWILNPSATLSVRPTSAILVRFEPSLNRRIDKAQYVRAVDDPLAVETLGARYVFATIDQTTLSLETRLNWTFSPTVSLQLYTQPLIVTGRYTDWKELRAPRTFAFDIYGRDQGTVGATPGGDVTIDPDGSGPSPSFDFSDPSFDFRSLLGNAVFRWEYRPGSALFIVWQQSRSGNAPYGDFDASRDLRGLFKQTPENIVAVKVTYWLGI